jgi:hypothetical protein
MANETGIAGDGVFGSKDFKLESLDLINSGGQTVDLKKIFVEMQIFQDIYSSVMHGEILINDGNDVFSTFYLVGNEYLKISIDKPGLNRPLKRLFRIFKASRREPSTDSGQSYVLHFCSDEMVSSQQILVSKSYKSSKIKQVVSDILVNELSVEPDRINKLEETSGSFDLIVPNYRPLEAIQWVTARGYDQNKFCYFFFENKQGFNLTSLQTLIKQPPYKTLKYEIKNSDRDPANNKDSIDNLDIVNDFDMLTSISNGAFSSRLMSIDIFTQGFNYIEYDLASAEGRGNLINKFKPVNSFKNSKDKTLFQSSDSFFRTYLSINDTVSEKSNDIKYWMLPRAMHMVMLNHFKIRVTLPGDIELKAGDIVNYEFPLFESANKAGKKLDKKRTGKYLVTAVNHKFSEDVFESIVELVSDSFAEQIPEAKEGLNRLSKKGK